MDILDAITSRHSVRSYIDKPIEKELCDNLLKYIDNCNEESGFHFQLVTNEPKAFDCFLAHYGKFNNVTNYIALIGKKDEDEKIGYYGEKIVLKAQMLGLNTCWVALSYKKVKDAFIIANNEKLYVVIALGYGSTQGLAHKSKKYDEVTSVKNAPQWFEKGVNAALLAPTAMNQQKFAITLDGDKVSFIAKRGFYTKLDLGIVKYHFEIGSGRKID